VHIDTGRYYAAKVINKRLMAGREHMVGRLVFSAADSTLLTMDLMFRSAMRLPF
jgi:hypothetical protein